MLGSQHQRCLASDELRRSNDSQRLSQKQTPSKHNNRPEQSRRSVPGIPSPQVLTIEVPGILLLRAPQAKEGSRRSVLPNPEQPTSQRIPPPECFYGVQLPGRTRLLADPGGIEGRPAWLPDAGASGLHGFDKATLHSHGRLEHKLGAFDASEGLLPEIPRPRPRLSRSSFAATNENSHRLLFHEVGDHHIYQAP